MARILFVCSRRASFIELDRRLLAERYELLDIYQPGRWANPLVVLRAVRASDAVVGWWASWHTFWPIAWARLLRRPSLLIVGGFDVADMNDIGYGHQRGGVRKRLSAWLMRHATQLMTNSDYSRNEIERNVGIAAEQVATVHHGLPDSCGACQPKPCPPVVLTVGAVDAANLERKGLGAFVQAAALLPEVAFVLVGPWIDGSIDELRAAAPANVTFTGWLAPADLNDRYREATVYVQASRHEGFGVAVAEAMLACCVPVVSPFGALPEVVGATGVQLEGLTPTEVAAGVRRALELGPRAGLRARERVLTAFPVASRRLALHTLVDGLLTETPVGRRGASYGPKSALDALAQARTGTTATERPEDEPA